MTFEVRQDREASANWHPILEYKSDGKWAPLWTPIPHPLKWFLPIIEEKLKDGSLSLMWPKADTQRLMQLAKDYYSNIPIRDIDMNSPMLIWREQTNVMDRIRDLISEGYSTRDFEKSILYDNIIPTHQNDEWLVLFKWWTSGFSKILPKFSQVRGQWPVQAPPDADVSTFENSCLEIGISKFVLQEVQAQYDRWQGSLTNFNTRYGPSNKLWAYNSLVLKTIHVLDMANFFKYMTTERNSYRYKWLSRHVKDPENTRLVYWF